MTVHCRIMKIDIEKFSADLTCRTSDLMDRNNEWKLPKDTYYDFDAEAADHKQEEDMKRKQQRTSEFLAGGSHLNTAYTRDLGCRVPVLRLTRVCAQFQSSEAWRHERQAEAGSNP